MTDDVTVDNGTLTDYVVSADAATADGALVQRVKLAYSADGSTTHVAADADGLLVNLGANNDVTVTGTVTASDGGGSLTVDDGGSSLTVDGSVSISGSVAVTDNSGSLTVDNAGTFAVQAAQSGTWTVQPGNTANTVAWKVDGSAVTQPVSIAAAVPVTDNSGSLTVDDGASSLTVDAPVGTPVYVRLSDGASAITTLPVSLASVPSHAVTNAGTFAVQESGAALTALQLIDNLVLAEDLAHTTADPGVQALAVRKATPANLSGTDGDYEPLQVSAGRLWASATIDAALPAGTNAIGKLAANSGVDIGDVDVTSVTPGTSATSLGKAADSVAGATDTGVAILAIRDDSLTTLTPADGDYAPLRVNSTGALHVTGGGGGTQYQEDAAHTTGDTGTMALAVRKDTAAALAGSDGDYTPLITDANGALHVAVASGSVTASGTISVDTITTSIVPGTSASHLGKAEDAAHASGDTGVMMLAVRKDTAAATAGTDGDYQPPITDSSGRLWVNASGAAVPVTDNSGSLTVDNAGTFAVQAASAGDTAHDAADSGNPVKVGFKAANALPTAVANADRANGISDLWGRQLTSHIDPAMQVTKTVNVTTTQTGTDVWSPTSGKRIAVTDLTISAYGTTAGRVILWFGDNADTTYSAGTDQVLEAASFAPSATVKSGLAKVYGLTPVFCTTADRELHLTTDAAMSLDITVRGYEW